LLSLADIYIGDDLLPAGFNVQLGVLLLELCLFLDVFLCPVYFLCFLLGDIFLQKSCSFLLSLLLILPLTFLR
jgi:hypothetical protein